MQEEIEMVRAIPGDILSFSDDAVQVIYFDPVERKSIERTFDLVVLSVGLTPLPDNPELASMLHLSQADSGFMLPHRPFEKAGAAGVFVAGTALGPMSIAESVSSAEKSVWDMLHYLNAGADDTPATTG
jgi:heterodisulfide reductase subunit A